MTDFDLIEHLLVVRRHLQVLTLTRALPELSNLDQLTERLILKLLTGAQLDQK
jgi:hypothetical protein